MSVSYVALRGGQGGRGSTHKLVRTAVNVLVLFFSSLIDTNLESYVVAFVFFFFVLAFFFPTYFVAAGQCAVFVVGFFSESVVRT